MSIIIKKTTTKPIESRLVLKKRNGSRLIVDNDCHDRTLKNIQRDIREHKQGIKHAYITKLLHIVKITNSVDDNLEIDNTIPPIEETFDINEIQSSIDEMVSQNEPTKNITIEYNYTQISIIFPNREKIFRFDCFKWRLEYIEQLISEITLSNQQCEISGNINSAIIFGRDWLFRRERRQDIIIDKNELLTALRLELDKLISERHMDMLNTNLEDKFPLSWRPITFLSNTQKNVYKDLVISDRELASTNCIIKKGCIAFINNKPIRCAILFNETDITITKDINEKIEQLLILNAIL